MGRKQEVRYACTRTPLSPTRRSPDRQPTHDPDTTPRMTTQITTPTDDDAYPTDQTSFEPRGRTDGAPMMFSPTSTATAGHFDTEAEDPR